MDEDAHKPAAQTIRHVSFRQAIPLAEPT